MKTPSKLLAAGTLLACLLSSSFAQPEALEITIETVAELPEGRETDGIIGDFLLRNDVIEAVISQNAPHRRPNMSTFYGDGGETPGCLYDLSLRGVKHDQLTIFTPSAQRGPVSWVRIADSADDGEAVVEVVTTAAQAEGLYTKHEYRLRDGEFGLYVHSLFRNESEKPITKAVRDVWARFETHDIVGRYHWGDTLDPSDHCGYAYGWLTPDETKTEAKVTIAPGESFEIERFIAVGKSPVEAMGRLAAKFDESGQLKLKVKGGDGKVVSDGQVILTSGDRDGRIPGYFNEQGLLEVPFVKGKWNAVFSAAGRPDATRSYEVGDSAVEDSVELAAATQINFQVADQAGKEIPCKVQFLGINGTKSPNLGPVVRAHGCKDQWHSEKGNFSVKLPAGSYQVVITRGPEYTHHEQEVTLEQGQTLELAAKLERVVDTTGWISADFHNHSTPSGDNVCGTDDRVINLAVENLEFVPTTEHNRIYDWTPHIEKLGLADELITVPGMELTGRGAHINSFPLKPVPRTQDNGAPVWEVDPRVNVLHLRNLGGWNPKRWTQINHPDMSENFIDRDKNKKADGGFVELGTHVNGVETQNYRTSNILYGAPFRVSNPLAKGSRIDAVREFVWLQLLNQGAQIWGVAVADAHTVHGNGVGSWRVYLPSDTDEPSKANPEALTDHAREGHMYLSSGPFMNLTMNGEKILPGQSLDGRKRALNLGIKVQCTDWFDIDRVQILLNGRQDHELNFTREEHPDLFQDGVVQFEREIPLTLTEDTHVIVVAIGENSSLEKGFGTSAQSPVKPCVYNNPIFIDANGGGFTPNGDTLGYDLPVGGLSVDEVRAILDK